MEQVRTTPLHFALRAVITLVGALLLWAAPASAVGLFVMLVGLVCAVGGLTLEMRRQF